MRDVMERFAVLPFSMGCVSQSSIAVGSNPSKKSKLESNTAITGTQEGESSSRMKMKNPWGSNISRRIHKFIASLKSFSQLFDYNEDEAVEEFEIEIGFPTDVKHVTHIGWDGSMSRNVEKNWPENLQTPELLSFPSLTLKQFELAMAAQAGAPHSEPSQLDSKQIG